jgi:hypothetical protein
MQKCETIPSYNFTDNFTEMLDGRSKQKKIYLMIKYKWLQFCIHIKFIYIFINI